MTEVTSNDRGKELSQQKAAAMSELPQHHYNLPSTEMMPKGLAINGNIKSLLPTLPLICLIKLFY